MRVAVIGHVEHVTIATVDALPRAGEISHLESPIVIPGGGGGIAFAQFARGPGDVHLFTGLGNDDAARSVQDAISSTGAQIHAARRDEPHTRDLVLVTPDGQRTIVVIGKPLHPARDDALPWHVLATCDAAYFTGEDPATLQAARDARLLVVTARRRHVLRAAGVRADIVVGSAQDPREATTMDDYPVRPGALVMTQGELGGRVETAEGRARFAAAAPATIIGSYGAGDTFAAALTWYAARGLPVADACARAAVHATAVLAGINPLDHQLDLE